MRWNGWGICRQRNDDWVAIKNKRSILKKSVGNKRMVLSVVRINLHSRQTSDEPKNKSNSNKRLFNFKLEQKPRTLRTRMRSSEVWLMTNWADRFWKGSMKNQSGDHWKLEIDSLLLERSELGRTEFFFNSNFSNMNAFLNLGLVWTILFYCPISLFYQCTSF